MQNIRAEEFGEGRKDLRHDCRITTEGKPIPKSGICIFQYTPPGELEKEKG